MNAIHPRALALLLASLVSASAVPEAGGAQSWETAAGAVVGTAGGTFVSMAVVTGSARTGRYLHAPADARWELLPIPLGALAGGILGHRNPDRLWRGVGWGTGGLAVGSLAGAGAGRILWGTREGAWSGAILGGSAGLLAGALAGVLTWEGEGSPPLAAQIRIPLP